MGRGNRLMWSNQMKIFWKSRGDLKLKLNIFNANNLNSTMTISRQSNNSALEATYINCALWLAILLLYSTTPIPLLWDQIWKISACLSRELANVSFCLRAQASVLRTFSWRKYWVISKRVILAARMKGYDFVAKSSVIIIHFSNVCVYDFHKEGRRSNVSYCIGCIRLWQKIVSISKWNHKKTRLA